VPREKNNYAEVFGPYGVLPPGIRVPADAFPTLSVSVSTCGRRAMKNNQRQHSGSVHTAKIGH